MNPEKIGKFIKDIRIKNNLTQKDLADKYNVTYQAVSKWENGKNLPDILLIRQIAKDFNINVEDILDGSVNKKKNIFKIIIPIILVILMIIVILLLNSTNNGNTFNSKTVTSLCTDFNVNGVISYDSNKSSIFINNINYNGCEQNTVYKSIECNLYEDNSIIKSCDKKDNITIPQYLNNLTFYVENYEQVCKNYDHNHIVLRIKAIDYKGEEKNFEVPLKLDSNCN